MTAPLPDNEAERLDALSQYGVLDTPPEPEYDDLVRLAASVCQMPIAAISLIDRDRQWFKAFVGLASTQTQRDTSFCAHTIRQTEPLVVPNTLQDKRFADNPLVMGVPHLRFYAGIPLVTPEGLALGTLCVADRQPRSLTADQLRSLEALGRQTMSLLHLRRMVAQGGTSREALLESQRQLKALTDNVPALIGRVNTERRYVFCNEFYHDFTGLRAEEVIGKTLAEVLGEAAYQTLRPRVDRVLAGEALTFEAPLLYQRTETRHMHISYVPEFGPTGEVTGYIVSALDISVRKALEEERERRLAQAKELLAVAQEQADRDPVTGLWNHRAFHKRLEEEADRAQREGTSLAVAMLDLDNFKFFNDAYGHLAGDGVLRQVARVLGDCCRSYDTLARFGGDEFALLMPGGSREDITALEHRLTACLQGVGYRPAGQATVIPIGLSAGVALFPDEAATRLEALELADTRLRRRKTGADEDDYIERLRTQLRETREGFSMLDALLTAVDNKDRYTRRHSEDVLTYSLQIAEALGLDKETRQTVAVAALLHDVGKIGVPDAILRKPGRLTDAEFEAIKQHPTMGAIMVSAVPGFELTLDAVRHHHERWDGGGYPFGLAGEQIPLLARLMAVADAFSAMTTDRPYRKGMVREKALDILQAGAGTQWDVECVRAFQCAQECVPAVGGCEGLGCDAGFSRRLTSKRTFVPRNSPCRMGC